MQSLSLSRNCPLCNMLLEYKARSSYLRAMKRNDVCRECGTGKKALSQDKIDQIVQLNIDGLLNLEIAKKLNCATSTVDHYIRVNNGTTKLANQSIDKISETEARCRRCKEIKLISKFQFGRKGKKYEYRFAYCNECRTKQVIAHLNGDVNKFLAYRFTYIKRRARKNNIPFSISKKEFINQYHSQNGLCFYTDAKMICKVGNNLHRDSLSVDKLIPEKGYCFGNVVFSTHRINTCKNDLSLDDIKKWMPDWYQRIEKFLEGGK